jgi:hypothetical protein
LFLALGAGWYTSQNFAINTDSEQLIDAKVGWRMRQARFDADFPQKTNLTAVVIDGKTPELAESATARLTEKLRARPELFTTVRMATLTYAIITAGVYNLLLRNVPYDGFQGLSWPNEVIHVWIPILIVLDWLISPGRPALSWKALRVVMIYPLLWLAYSLVRGAVSNGIYPYPFLDPATAGWGSVIAYIVALSLVLLGLATLAIVYSRRVGREAIRRQS